VGIWFITGILAPEGIGSLIHLFFWPWFIEWWAFTTEVVLLLVYYFLWDRLTQHRPRLLMALGWAYVAVALSSAVLISGILGFMLTPDGWPQGGTFSQAYFNPTFVPQFMLRISAGIVLGALLILGWTAWRFKGTAGERGRVLRLTGLVMLAAVVSTAAFAWVYFSRIPMTYLTHWKFAVATSVWSQVPNLLPVLNTVAVACLVLAAVAGLLKRRKISMVLFLPALLLAVGMVAEFERVREFVRGPYLLPGYMYANQVRMVRQQAASQQGRPLLPSMNWVNAATDNAPDARTGRALFDANCGVCHTIGGINDITVRLQGRTLESVNALTSITESMVPFMTPFNGSEQERLVMSTYLYSLANKNTLPRPQLQGEVK
jgi:cytochrome bd-type quinol oxidase subunit 1